MSAHILSSDIKEFVERLSTDANVFAGNTVLLTGGRGFLGRYFMEVFDAMNRELLNTPVTLVAIDNMITAGEQGAQIPNLQNIEFLILAHY